jgi:leader peptidase (prepilin peptidase)/N-methyltransferase
MVALLILAGLLTGVLLNLLADGLQTPDLSRAETRVRFSVHAPACPACGRTRSPLAWSALLALATRRRRCRSCSTPISVRHSLVEAAMIALYIILWIPLDTHWAPEPVITRILYTLYGAIVALILVTDLEFRLVPHAVMLPALLLAVVGAFVNPAWRTPTRALLGGALGLLCALALYGGGILFARLLGRIRGEAISETAFGFGDVTLITFIGLVVGAPEIVFALTIGLLSGGLFALFYVVLGVLRKRYTLFAAIPYAPFLILGGAVMLVFGPDILAWYL